MLNYKNLSFQQINATKISRTNMVPTNSNNSIQRGEVNKIRSGRSLDSSVNNSFAIVCRRERKRVSDPLVAPGYMAHTWSQWRRFAAAVLLPGSRHASSGSPAAAAGGRVLLARGGHATRSCARLHPREEMMERRKRRLRRGSGRPRPRARQH